MEQITNSVAKLEALNNEWRESANKRRALVLAVVSKIDEMVSYRLVVEGGERAWAFLTPGTYDDDTFYHGHRQQSEITEAGMYRIDAKLWNHCHEIAVEVSEDGIRKLRITKSIMPKIVQMIDAAVERELALIEAAQNAVNTLQGIHDLLGLCEMQRHLDSKSQ